jgi:Pro-kumamolisin, activation domain
MRLKFVFAVLLVTSSALAQQPQQRRIVRPVDNASPVRLQGTLAPRARADLDRGLVAATMPLDRITMVFARTAAQQADLDRMLAAQHDPTSPEYHKWLTPEEFGDRFGLADADLSLVGAWLTAQGFTVDEIARSRTWIAFHGTAAQVEAAFHAPLHNFMVAGELHFAPSAEAAVPDAFAPVVAAITGLNDFRPRPHSSVRHPGPRLTSSLSGNHFVVPGDFGTIYDLPDYVNGVFQPGNDGTGQTIGIVGQTSATGGTIAVSTISSDTATFRIVSQLPPGTLNLVPVGTPGQFTSGDADESNLDVQRAGSVAPGATITLAYSNNALNTSLPQLVQLNPSTISISYGDCEANFSAGEYTTIETALSQAQAQGTTVTASAGDNAATDCDGNPQTPATIATHGLAVDYPASSQYVIAMGGTAFIGDGAASSDGSTAAATQYWNSSSSKTDMSPSAFSYIPETTWNDSATTNSIVGTGGGASKKFPKPSWQTGTGVPNDNARDVPDIALNSSPSHDGYIICSQGSCQNGTYRKASDDTFTVIGGTSAASPSFAGIAALINQKLGGRQGNLNTKLYSLAASAPWAFTDITTGDNKAPCQTQPVTPDCTTSPIGFSAAPGYDQVTGWGSIDATAFLNALSGTPNPHFLVLPNSRYETITNGNSDTVALTVVPKEGFSGTVTLTCAVSSSLTGATCNFDNTNVNTPGSANVTIQTGSGLGPQAGTVTLTGTSGGITNSVVMNVSVATPDFTLTSANATETVSTGGSTTDTITITPVQGFIGTVNFTCSGTTGLTCSLSTNPVTVSSTSAVTSTLTVNASSSATTGSVTTTATGGGLTHTLQIPVTVNVVPPNFTLTVASPVVSIPSGGTITDNLTVTAVGGFNSDVALTCSVAGSLGTTTCTVSPTTVVGGNGSALITLKGAVLSRDVGGPLPFQHRGLGIYASYVFSLGFVMLGAPAASSGRRRNRRAWMSIAKKVAFGLLLASTMFGAVSCGGGGGGGGGNNTGPTPLTGNVTITGVGGGITQTATINVTVI